MPWDSVVLEVLRRNFNLHSGVIPACCIVLSLQVSGVPEDQLLVSLYPGLPTTAELFILPVEHTSSEHKRGSEEALETVRIMICRNIGLVNVDFYQEKRFHFS